MSDSPYCITFDDILAAAKRIEGLAHKTPVLTSSSLNEVAKGRKLFFKVEALQKTGSFKFRGAVNAIFSLIETTGETDETIQVVTHSSGNHAQALALAAKTAGGKVKATIVMPESAPGVKKAAVLSYGGHVIDVESTNEARESKANEVQREMGAEFIHPSEDPRVIAGQGTACLEMIAQVKDLNEDLQVVVIPVGGGGLASGNITTLRGLLGKNVKIILAEPKELDDAKRSFYAGELLRHSTDNKLKSVADGLKTTLGPNTWPIIRDFVDDIYTVSEEEILRATKLIWERLKVCIEPSAGVGVAVVMGEEFQNKYPVEQYKNVGIILCGGNVDFIKTSALMAKVL